MKTLLLTLAFVVVGVVLYEAFATVAYATIATNEFRYHRGTIDLTKTQIDAILRRPI